jgi:heat shock protein HspQ
MESETVLWSDELPEDHQYQDVPHNAVITSNDNKDEIVYISPNNNVFWGYLKNNLISQDLSNLDKFIKKKFYIINKNGVRKLYEYRKLNEVMFVCNDNKLYNIKDNTLVETLTWDYATKSVVKSQQKPKQQIYKTKIFIYSWIYLDNLNETDKLVDSFTSEEMQLPNNVNELKDIKFYFITNESKQLFKIRKGNSAYYIADDGNLYIIDENNMIPGVFKNRQQKWVEVSRIEQI